MNKKLNVLMIVLIALFSWSCQKEDFWDEKTTSDTMEATYRAKPGGETAGNNLSFPVIWAEGEALNLREVDMSAAGAHGIQNQNRYGMPISIQAIENPAYLLDGEWWYWWGTAGDGSPLACPPDSENPGYCDDGTEVEQGAIKVYVQKDPDNMWQAQNVDGSSGLVFVDSIDWGDNLESVDWYTKSQVRTEVVLYKDLIDDPVFTPMLEYEMRHLAGLGADELHGVATDAGGVPFNSYDYTDRSLGTQATVYSSCARLTIQKLLIPREDVRIKNNQVLTWVPEEGLWAEAENEEDIYINDPIFNLAVHEAQDGPGYYNAEVNVKGKVIFGYTWNVRKLNDPTKLDDLIDPAAGDYRLTFSLDEGCPTAVGLNTTLNSATIIRPVEGEEVVVPEDEGAPGDGGYPELYEYELGKFLTYVDVRILDRKTGNNNGGGQGSGNSGNNGNGDENGGGKGGN